MWIWIWTWGSAHSQYPYKHNWSLNQCIHTCVSHQLKPGDRVEPKPNGKSADHIIPHIIVLQPPKEHSHCLHHLIVWHFSSHSRANKLSPYIHPGTSRAKVFSWPKKTWLIDIVIFSHLICSCFAFASKLDDFQSLSSLRHICDKILWFHYWQDSLLSPSQW